MCGDENRMSQKLSPVTKPTRSIQSLFLDAVDSLMVRQRSATYDPCPAE